MQQKANKSKQVLLQKLNGTDFLKPLPGGFLGKTGQPHLENQCFSSLSLTAWGWIHGLKVPVAILFECLSHVRFWDQSPGTVICVHVLKSSFISLQKGNFLEIPLSFKYFILNQIFWNLQASFCLGKRNLFLSFNGVRLKMCISLTGKKATWKVMRKISFQIFWKALDLAQY